MDGHLSALRALAASAALERGDHAAATAMFDEDCYWRDLVSFTWNIKTMEGQDQIADMLRALAARGSIAARAPAVTHTSFVT